MNCKPGDLAVIVQSHDERNIGKFVTVLDAWDESSWWIVSTSVLYARTGDIPAGKEIGAYDSHLRPIRDSDGEDETLTWAGKPRSVFIGDRRVHVPIERLIPVNPLPHAVGGDPLRTWPDESTAWEGIQ